MKHLFVPYEIALKLKEKGFDEPCLSWYYQESKELCEVTSYLYEGSKNSENNIDRVPFVTAPLYQQVIDWLFGITGAVIVYNPADIGSVNKVIIQWLDKLESIK